MGDTSGNGLRERKKRRLREQIRHSAVTLFVANGYRGTTMEQIAAAADVAPRTVYRYFPTKDVLVVSDEDDELMLDRFRTALDDRPPLDAFRQVLGDLLVEHEDESETDRHRRALIAAEPELQGAMVRFVLDLARRYAEVIVQHTGRPEDADAALALSGAVAGIVLVTVRWDAVESPADQLRRLDLALERLAGGLTVGEPRARSGASPASLVHRADP